MDDPINRGLPFVTGNLWRTPTHFGDAIPDEDSLFRPLQTQLPALNLERVKDSPHFTFDLDLPDLPEQDGAADLQLDQVPVSPSHNGHAAGEDEHDQLGIWSLDEVLEKELKPPKLCTWENFEKQSNASESERVAFLSDVGPAAFDAAIRSLEPYDEVGVLPQDYTLRALSNLVLGRSSSLFQWNDSKRRFEQTIQGVSISGTSRLCSNGLVEELIDMGSNMANARSFADGGRSVRSTNSASPALRSCASTILSAVEEDISRQVGTLRSLLQLQHLIRISRRLVCTLQKAIDSSGSSNEETDIISAILQVIDDETPREPGFRGIFEAMAARVTVPWFEQLANGIGFQGPTIQLTGSNFAAGDGAEGALDCPFASAEDRTLINETQVAAKMLRLHAPEHPLLASHAATGLAPFDCFIDATCSYARVSEVAQQYEARVLKATKISKAYGPIKPEAIPSQEPAIAHWNQADSERYLSELGSLMSNQVEPEISASNHLHQQVTLALQDRDGAAHNALALEQGSALTALARVRPLIQVQHRLINAVLLRQIFREEKLNVHLDLQRQFHLFGNGNFVTRLTTALFSVDVQSAERRKGVRPTGEIMGLRLGTSHEERWPPASSELQLTLMGILIEAYSGRSSQHISSERANTTLPGGLSFAIRQLPEAEIERVLDPNSIYALDFLRLQYNAKNPLDAIFAPAALGNYDNIFRFMLRLLRVLHVSSNLRRKVRSPKFQQTETAAFASKAHHFITVLASHVIDVGISAPWRLFVAEVSKVEQELRKEDEHDQLGSYTTIGIQGLQRLHHVCLDQIRCRLMLRGKQEKLHTAVDDVLSATLKSSFAVQTEPQPDINAFSKGQQDFNSSVEKLHRLLQAVVNKPPKPSTMTTDTDEIETSKLLLAKLNWNGYYDDKG